MYDAIFVFTHGDVVSTFYETITGSDYDYCKADYCATTEYSIFENQICTALNVQIYWDWDKEGC